MFHGKILMCSNFVALKGCTGCITSSQYRALRDIKDDISFLFSGTFLFEWNSFLKKISKKRSFK